MPWIALAVLIDSVVVLTMGTKLQRTAKKEANRASEAFKQALAEVGPEVMAQAITIALARQQEGE